jgi:hypothetical protein
VVANRAFVFESESWITLSISTLTIRRTNGIQNKRTDDVVFERNVLSISDEAFLLVVLLNYASRWHVEYANEIKEVRTYALCA